MSQEKISPPSTRPTARDTVFQAAAAVSDFAFTAQVAAAFDDMLQLLGQLPADRDGAVLVYL